MPTLPITAVLCTKNGIVLRYMDGREDGPFALSTITASLAPIELEAVKYACSNPGWVVLDTYQRIKG